MSLLKYSEKQKLFHALWGMANGAFFLNILILINLQYLIAHFIISVLLETVT